jgi:hypothetical protein
MEAYGVAVDRRRFLTTLSRHSFGFTILFVAERNFSSGERSRWCRFDLVDLPFLPLGVDVRLSN